MISSLTVTIVNVEMLPGHLKPLTSFVAPARKTRYRGLLQGNYCTIDWTKLGRPLTLRSFTTYTLEAGQEYAVSCRSTGCCHQDLGL